MLICHLLQEEVGHSYFQHCVNFQLCSTSSVGIAASFLSLGVFTEIASTLTQHVSTARAGLRKSRRAPAVLFVKLRTCGRRRRFVGQLCFWRSLGHGGQVLLCTDKDEWARKQLLLALLLNTLK